jgi:hypothetical protein
MRPFLYLFCTAILFAGCAPTHHLIYSTDDIRPARKPSLPVTLRVETFRDLRRAIPDNDILFKSSNEQVVDGRRRCVNGEKWYPPDGAVAQEVSLAVASHISKRRVVRVHTDGRVHADYVLRGSIRRIYGVQNYHWGSAIGASFGLIGAAATANNQSLATIWIEFDDLTLLDTSGRVLTKLAPLNAKYNRMMPIDAYCSATYHNVKDHLKLAIAQLALRVERAIRELRQPTPHAVSDSPSGAVRSDTTPAWGNIQAPREKTEDAGESARAASGGEDTSEWPEEAAQMPPVSEDSL